MGFLSSLGELFTKSINPVLSGVSAFAGPLLSMASQSSANASNERIANATNEMSLQAMRENNQFSAFEAEKARLWNSPDAMVSRYKQAGLNPAVMMSQGSQAPVLSQGQPSGVPHLTPAHFAAPNIGSFDIFQGLKTLSEARKAGVESDRLRKLVDEQFKSLQLNNRQQEIINDFLPDMQDSLLRKNLQQAFSYEKQAELYAEQGKTEETQRAVNDAMKAYYYASQRMNNANADLLKAKADSWKTEVTSRLATEASQRGLNSSLSSMYDENKNLIHENVRDILRRNNVLDMLNSRLTSRLSSEELEKNMSVFERSVFEGLNKSVSEGHITEDQSKQLRETLPSLIQQAKDDAAKGHPWSSEYFLDRLLGSLSGGVHFGASVIKGVKP